MAKITHIWAREILDSRSTPTIEAALSIDTNHVTLSSVPSGASIGSHEALELRDNDLERFKGKGVLRAVATINQVIAPALIGMDPTNQLEIDNRLIEIDGTENKSSLGANSILAVSEVVAKAGAIASGTSLYKYINLLSTKIGLQTKIQMPIPIFNMIEGGKHGAVNLDFQEFFVIPVRSKTYSDGLRMASEIYMTLGENLTRRGAIHSVGIEGGYAPNLFTNADALEIIVDSIKQTEYNLGTDLVLGLDVAANTIFKNGSYQIRDKSSPMDETSFIEYFKNLNETYHLAILEDPLQEDAWAGWVHLTEALKDQTIVVGDDLLVTNPKRIAKAIAEKAGSAAIIKPNQIGTVTETLKVIKLAKDAQWKIVVSHRGGETNDWFIADFAVGVGADYVKFGAPARGERLAKYNRLLAVEAELSSSTK
ncbi:MAG: phosphopyruvate hydratase [Patescibacteria group bacterium]